MASTKLQCVNEFREAFYPDCPLDTAKTLFDRAYKLVLKTLRVRGDEIVVSLTSGTREYTIDSNILSIKNAYYQRSSNAGNWVNLTPSSLDMMDALTSGWRIAGYTSEPSSYYTNTAVNGNTSILKIGFYPIPQTTTSGGYPRVVLYVNDYADLGDSDTVPPMVLTDNVYLYYMAKQWAERQDAPRVAYWSQLFDAEMVKESNHARGNVENAPRNILVSAATMRTPRGI